MLITSIEKNKKYNNKYRVYIDNKFAFAISEEDYITTGLYEKKEISEEEVQYIKDHILFKSAKQSAIKYLTLKYRSEHEVRLKLHRDGFSDDIIKNVVTELKSMGYINDTIYTQKYVFDRSKLKPKSKKMLKYELKNKGVSDDIIDNVLENWELDDRTVAVGLIKKKFGKYDMRDQKVFKKAFAFLRHRGFEQDVIIDVLNQFKR